MKKKRYFIFWTGLLILLAYCPHLQKEMFVGSDDIFHYYRIQALSDMLKAGESFPIKIHFTSAYGYGYGVGFFYSNALLYIPAILMNVCGLSLANAYKVFAFLVFLAIWGAMYYSVWTLTQKKEIALLAASILIFSNKVMESFYLTIAIGQMCAYIFVPMAIIGMYMLLEKRKKPYLLIAGFTGLIHTHTISTFLTLVACFMMVLFYSDKIYKEKRQVIDLISAVIIVTALTSSYWLPMIEQMKAQMFKVKAPWTTSKDNVSSIEGLVTGREGIGYVIFILLILSCLMLLKRIKINGLKENRGGCCLISIAIGMGLITTYSPFWYFMNITLGISLIQFPVRLNMIVTVLTIIIFAVLYSELKINSKVKQWFGIIMIIFAILISYVEYSSDYMQTDNSRIEQVLNGEVAGIGAGEEWLPIMTTRDDLVDSNVAIDNEGNRITGKKLNYCTDFVFTADLSKEYYDIPYVWYKGFKAVDSTGEIYEITQNADNGLVQVIMPQNMKGSIEVTVSYSGTKYQKLAYAGSMIGCLMLLFYVGLNSKDYKKQSK